MKLSKDNKGITLVALVITIIILLILAGVAISSLMGSGLFNKAIESKDKAEIAQEVEQLKLAIYAVKADYLNNNGNIYYSEIEKEIKNSYGESIKATNGIKPVYVDDNKEIEIIKSKKNNIVSKLNNEFKLSNLFMSTVFADDTNNAVYAKVTYKSNRVYYIRVDSKNESLDPDLPGKTGDIIPTEQTDNTPQTGDDTKTDAAYFEWEYTSYEDIDNNVINGWEIKGLSDEGKKAACNGELKNINLPDEYTGDVDGKQITKDLIGIGYYAMSDNDSFYQNGDWVDYMSYVEKINVPSTVKYIDKNSLGCVTAYGTKVSFEEGLEKVETEAFGSGATRAFVSLPDSVKKVSTLSANYNDLYLSVGKNFENNDEYGSCSCSGLNKDVLFYRGTIDELKANVYFTSNYQYELSKTTSDGGYIYCLGDGKRASQIGESGNYEYEWEEITDLSSYLENKGLGDDKTELIKTLTEIENEAKTEFK